MKAILKRAEIYVVFLILLSILVISFVYNSSNKLIENIEQSIVKITDIYFENILNTRKWNASYGGVYVKDNGNIKPNKYLIDNHMYSKDDELLIKINPAWMTRQLSELNQNQNYFFKIVSQKPINHINQANEFEDKALSYLLANPQKNSYYEFDLKDKKFKYLGKLLVDNSCMPCHKRQGYNIGDIRGGISVYKNLDDEILQIENINSKKTFFTVLIVFVTSIMSILIVRIFNHHKHLEIEVDRRTAKLEEERMYLQTIKDANKDIMVVTNGNKLLDANLAFLNFFNVSNIDEFLKNHRCICDFFEEVDDEDYISGKFVNNEIWAIYISKNKKHSNKVMIKKDKDEYVFLLTAQYLKNSMEEKILVVFSDITSIEKSKNRLEYLASIDELTKIMNRAKFNSVMEDEIQIAKSYSTPLSIIFFDIDHFKMVNDTYGHDVGDIILIELSELIKNNIRKDDFFARWGGEEFVVVIKENIELAYNLADKLRIIIENNSFTKVGKLTCSFGVSTLAENDDCDSLVKRSDEALYISKDSGRNRVTKK